MHTMHEQSGLPDTSYEETPLLGAQSERQNSWDALTRVFPRASATSLETSYSKTRRLQVKMFGAGKKVYNLFTKDPNTGKERLNPSLTKEIKTALGESAEDIIAEDRDTLQEQRQRLVEAEIQQREAEKIAAEKEKEEQEMQNLRQQIDRTFERINALNEQHGSNLESEAELRRFQMLKKNYEIDLENKKKEIAALEKIAKNKEKAQRKVERESAKLAEKEKERNLIEERLNSIKSLDDLKEQESELKRKNEEDQAIIQDENTSPSERGAAEARYAERNEELARLQARVEERERALPLL